MTVRATGFEYIQGRPYKSLSAIARAIADTRWKGCPFWVDTGGPHHEKAGRPNCAWARSCGYWRFQRAKIQEIEYGSPAKHSSIHLSCECDPTPSHRS
jgi:hypothetical protein